MAKKESHKVLATNRKARHEYFIENTVEAGIVLKGTEVKSVRQGKVNLKESYAAVQEGELFVYGMHISPYEQGNRFNEDPVRKRKLLLHKREIHRLEQQVAQSGMTLVVLSLYLKNGLVKTELAVAKGKKLYDKRAALAEKDAKRHIERAMREHNKW